MSTVYSADYTTLVRDQLQDVKGGTELWADEEIADHVLRAIKDISLSRPYLQETVLSVTDERRTVDISSLSSRVYIDRVEFYVDQDVRRWRNWTEFGDEITMDIGFNADASDTLLTGTVTFAASASVTGSGTAFETEAPAGSYIKNSADTAWYEVLSVASDTALTLRKSYGGTTGADTAATTPMRTNKQVARIFWGGMHTVGAAATTMPTELEQLIVDGACAYTLRAYASEGRELLDDAQGIMATANTQLDLIDAQMTLMKADVALGRADIEKQVTAAGTAIGKVITNTEAADTYMDTGDDYIPTVNVGANVASTYIQYAQAEMQQAMNYLQEYKAFITEGGTIIGEDLAVAAGELRVVDGYIKNAQGFFSEGMAEVRTAQGILQHSMAEADRREAMFRDGLKRAQGRQKRTPKNSLLTREA